MLNRGQIQVHPQIENRLKPHLKRLPRGLKTRFAPSPTGFLHLGHVASALYIWGIAKAIEAEIILRIEDHDQGRSRKEYEVAILNDLKWLGWNWDHGVHDSSASKFRQSNQVARYQECFNSLSMKGLTYACACNRRDLMYQPISVGQGVGELRYLGQCRLQPSGAGPFGYRVKFEAKAYRFYDFYVGLQAQCPAIQCGDLLIKDKDDNWTYNFSSVVDDWDQGVNLIIRGQDLTHCVARQFQLARILGREDRFWTLHHPLLVDPQSGKKLSKRDRSVSISAERAKGVSPEEIIGKAAFLGGIVAEERPLTLDEIARIFRS